MCAVLVGIVLFIFGSVECSKVTAAPENKGCILPPKPQFGDWQVNDVAKQPGDDVPANASITFRCNPGYKLIPNITHVICDQYWDPSNVPQCKELCPAFYSTSSTRLSCRDTNGIKIDCSEVTDGGSLSYQCNPYYETAYRSQQLIYCVDGHWNSQKPVCEPVCGQKFAGTHSWMVQIYYKSDDDDEFEIRCAGNIIARNLIVTAAHCVTDFTNDEPLEPTKFKVAAAKLYEKYQDARDLNAQYVDVATIIVQDQYKGEKRRYSSDIALILTKQLLILGPQVQLICLTDKNDQLVNSEHKREVARYIQTKNGSRSEKVEILEIPYKSQQECNSELPDIFVTRFVLVDKFCAGFHNGTVNVCIGNRGSGLVVLNPKNDRYYLHGILSLDPRVEDRCMLHRNALYTDVGFHFKWITNFIVENKAEECKLPPYPEYGRYVVDTDKTKKPGDTVISEELLTVTCNVGYVPIANRIKCKFVNKDVLKCQESSNSTAKNSMFDGCELPSTSRFGSWEIIRGGKNLEGKLKPDTVLHFKCKPGYKISLDPFLICDKHWNISNIPQCQQLCPEFCSSLTTQLICQDSDGVKIDCTDVVDGGTLTYKCQPYYEIPSKFPRSLNCQKGTWSAPKSVCEPVCGKNDANTYPWNVVIYYKNHNTYDNICGGNIITRKLIITAARCVTNRQVERFKIAAGKLYDKFQVKRDQNSQYVDVETIFVHPDYLVEDNNNKANVALILSKQLFKLDLSVQPICVKRLNDMYFSAANTIKTSRWIQNVSGEPTNVLKFLDIPYKSQEKCKTEMLPETAEKFLSPDKICAGSDTTACAVSSNSGSGLVFENREDNRYYLYGILHLLNRSADQCSFDKLYTNVPYYDEWIKKYVTKYEREECQLPPYPENGKYVVASDKYKQPGDMVASEESLTVVCDAGYSPKIPSSSCESANSNVLKCQVCGQKVSGVHTWMVQIYHKETAGYQHFCAGNIITRKLVLSVAHCVTNSYGEALPTKKFKIAAAKLYFKYEDPRDVNAQFVDVEQIFIHSHYRGEARRFIADISMILTKQLFKWGQLVQPVCLKFNSNALFHVSYDREMPRFVRTENGTISDKIEFLDVPYQTETECEKELPIEFVEKYVQVDKICAGSNTQNMSVCKGNSGSGLVGKNLENDRYFLYGLLSIAPRKGEEFGICDLHKGSLCTKVDFYFEWTNQYVVKYEAEECELPPYPENGRYIIENNNNKQPGDRVSSEDLLTVICESGYTPIKNSIRCESANNDVLKCQESYFLNYGHKINTAKAVSNLDTDWARPLVWNGQILRKITYPWIAAVYRNNGRRYIHVCGGNIISKTVILTAAHCVTDNNNEAEPAEKYLVAVGKIYRDYSDTRDKKVQLLNIRDITIAPQYAGNDGGYFADLALIILNKPITMNDFVQPVCINKLAKIILRTTDVGEIAGWGLTEDEVPSDVLRALKIPYKNQTQCIEEFPPRFRKKYNLTGKICAGFRGQDTAVCVGDSGSGLVFENPEDGRYYIHGLVSITPGTGEVGTCNSEQNALYTKVADFFQWIVDHMKKYHQD